MRFHELIKPTVGCSVCDLRGLNPGLLFTLHELRRRGLSAAEVLRRGATAFTEARWRPPAVEQLEAHYTQHCAWPDVRPIAQDDFETDYLELRDLYGTFRAIFERAMEELREMQEQQARADADEEGSGAGPSPLKYANVLKLAGELRMMLKTLSDMRNSDKLFSVILLRHTEQLVTNISGPVGSTLREVRDRLLRGDDPKVIATDIDRLLDTEGEIYQLFKAAATSALEQSQQQYKLH